MRRTIKRSIPFTDVRVWACAVDEVENEIVELRIIGHYTLERLKAKIQLQLEQMDYLFVKIDSLHLYEEERELNVEIFVKYSTKCEEEEK